jgi:hypothetical protein
MKGDIQLKNPQTLFNLFDHDENLKPRMRLTPLLKIFSIISPGLLTAPCDYT